MMNKIALIFLLALIAINFAYPKSISEKLMDYTPGLLLFEEGIYEEAEFNERDSFLGFRHIINPGKKEKEFNRDTRRSHKILDDSKNFILSRVTEILDSLKCINAHNDTITVIWIRTVPYINHYFIILTKKLNAYISPGNNRSVHFYPLNEFLEMHRNAQVMVDVISKWDETDISRLMSCSLHKTRYDSASAMRAIIKDNEVISRKIYVFPIFSDWCMYHRYHPDNPFREDILSQDRQAEYKRLLKEAQKINPDTVIDVDLDYLMGTKDENDKNP